MPVVEKVLPQIQTQAQNSVTFGKKSFTVEVASTEAALERGLSGRTILTEGTGMLFVFEQKAGHCFWMNNTKIHLSIAFIADDGRIVNIEEMQAETLNSHCPKATIRYALEMNKQWFSERVIVPGTVITGLPRK